AKDCDGLTAKTTERLASGRGGEPATKKAGRPVTGPAGEPAAARAEASPPARGRAEPRAGEPSPFAQDPRLPAPGTAISVHHKGKRYVTRFLGAEGFEYEGRRFRSLSAVAMSIVKC